jgi:hypothetical protein
MGRCKRYATECKRGCGDTCAAQNSYCPSNGTEGMMFTEEYCMHCLHCDPDPNGKKQCELLLATLCFYPTDPEYPREWIIDSLGKPKCTKYVNWNWRDDGDPDDPDNPKAPPPPTPLNQIDLFPLYPNEKDYESKRSKKQSSTSKY